MQQDAARLAYTVSADEDGFAVVDCPNLEAGAGGAAGLLAEWPGLPLAAWSHVHVSWPAVPPTRSSRLLSTPAVVAFVLTDPQAASCTPRRCPAMWWASCWRQLRSFQGGP